MKRRKPGRIGFARAFSAPYGGLPEGDALTTIWMA
jgi:hypothetical protein